MPEINEATQILEEPYIVSKRLQNPDCTLSDFYGASIIMKKKLSLWSNKVTKKTDLADILLIKYKIRIEELHKNESLISAVYLDRRYAANLDAAQTAMAKLHLCKLWERVTQKKNSEVENQINETADNSVLFESTENLSGIKFNDSDIENLFAAHKLSEENNTVSEPLQNASKDEFMLMLDAFEKKYPHIHHTERILKFWEEKKNEFPQIYRLATILYGIPPTQATVERVFSHMAFVYNIKRAKLSTQTLENLLTIRLNKNLLSDVFDDDHKILALKY